MTKERLLQIAELVCNANEMFRRVMPNGRAHVICMEISPTPEIFIQANWNGDHYMNSYRYRAVSPLLRDKLDPHFDAAEHRIRELMEEVRNGYVVSA